VGEVTAEAELLARRSFSGFRRGSPYGDLYNTAYKTDAASLPPISDMVHRPFYPGVSASEIGLPFDALKLQSLATNKPGTITAFKGSCWEAVECGIEIDLDVLEAWHGRLAYVSVGLPRVAVTHDCHNWLSQCAHKTGLPVATMCGAAALIGMCLEPKVGGMAACTPDYAGRANDDHSCELSLQHRDIVGLALAAHRLHCSSGNATLRTCINGGFDIPDWDMGMNTVAECYTRAEELGAFGREMVGLSGYGPRAADDVSLSLPYVLDFATEYGNWDQSLQEEGNDEAKLLWWNDDQVRACLCRGALIRFRLWHTGKLANQGDYLVRTVLGNVAHRLRLPGFDVTKYRPHYRDLSEGEVEVARG
jgi:hypothetical protein